MLPANGSFSIGKEEIVINAASLIPWKRHTLNAAFALWPEAVFVQDAVRPLSIAQLTPAGVNCGVAGVSQEISRYVKPECTPASNTHVHSVLRYHPSFYANVIRAANYVECIRYVGAHQKALLVSFSTINTLVWCNAKLNREHDCVDSRERTNAPALFPDKFILDISSMFST
jgi:hypothetical protein